MASNTVARSRVKWFVNADLVSVEMLHKVSRLYRRQHTIEEYHIRLNCFFMDTYAWELGDFASDELRNRMIFFERFDHFFESNDSCSGEDASLAHSTTYGFSELAHTIDHLFRADDKRPHRAAQPFAQAEAERVCILGDILDLAASRNRSVEDSCAVNVHLQRIFLSKLLDCFEVF